MHTKLASLLLLLCSPALAQGIGGKGGMAGKAGFGGGYVSPTFNACLIHAWPMNEGSGTTFHDIQGSNNLTLSAGGAVTWQSNTGMPGTTPYWNGTGHASATYGSDLDFSGTTAFSVIVWTVGSGGTAIQQYIVGTQNFSSASAYKGWGIFQNSNNGIINDQNTGVFNLVLSITGPFTGDAIQVTPDTVPISSPTLHFYGLSYDGSGTATGINIVQDGTTYNTTNSNLYEIFNNLFGSTANGNALYVGNDVGSNIPFTGAISNLAVYNCALSAATMTTYYGLGPRIN